MNIFERIAEAKIRQGQARGEFSNLAGEGKPIDLAEMRGVRAEDRAAFTVLRNSGFVPEEVHTRRELAGVESEMARGQAEGASDADFEQLRRRRLALELKRNLAADRRLGRL